MGAPMRYQPQGVVRLSKSRLVFCAWVGSGNEVVSGAQCVKTGANAPVPACTPSGRGFAFSGAPAKTGYLNLGYNAGVNALFGSPATLIFEIYPTDFAANYAIGSKSDNNGACGWDLSQNTSGGVSLTIIGANSNYTASSSGVSLVAGQRNTVVLVFNGVSTSSASDAPVRFYINGQLAGAPRTQASGPTSDSGQPLLVGARTYNESNVDYKGVITLVAFLRGMSSAADVASLHANPWQIFDAGSSGSAYLASTIVSSGNQLSGVVSAAGSSAGLSAVSASVNAIFRVSGVSSCAGTAAAAANSVTGVTGTSAGLSNVSAASNLFFQVSGLSYGSSTASATSVSISQTVGTASGVSGVSAGAVSIAVASGSSVNVATLQGAGSAVWQVTGGSAGISVVSGSSSGATSIVSSSGQSNGSSSAYGVASLISQAVANALGSSVVGGVGAIISAVIGSSSGSSAASSIGNAIAAGAAKSSGTSSASSIAVVIFQSAGFAPSAADVAGISQQVQQVVAMAAGKATVTGVTEGGVHYTAIGDKFALTLLLSPYKLELSKLPYNISLN